MDQELKDRFDKIDQNFEAVNGRFTELRNYLDQSLTEMEKRLIVAFRQLQFPVSSRMDSAEVLVQGFSARLASLEKRVSELELPEQ